MATTERDVPIGELASSRDESAAVMQQKQAAMGAEGIPADVTSLSEKLQNNTKRFLLDLCSGLNRDMAPNLSMEELQKMAVMLMAPDCVVHPDGLLGSVPPLVGPSAFLDFIAKERAAYRTVELTPLIVATSEDNDVAFALSHFKMKSVGPWHGKEATRRLSEGVRIDELHFDTECKVVEAWCNRQMFEEEREVLLRTPDEHHPAAFRPELLKQVPAEGLTSPQQLMRLAKIWTETWNCSSEAGAPDPSTLDDLAEPDFMLYDLMGLTGDTAQEHPYTAIRSLQDAKDVLVSMSHKYDINEAVQSAAVAPGYNAVFSHWRAVLTPQPSATSAAKVDVAIQPYSVEATDLILFSESGRISAICQFRRPLGSDRRRVLAMATASAAAAEPAGPPEEDVAMA